MLGGMSNREIQAVLEDIDVTETIMSIQDKVLDIAEAEHRGDVSRGAELRGRLRRLA